jgi:hypothetical protein
MIRIPIGDKVSYLTFRGLSRLQFCRPAMPELCARRILEARRASPRDRHIVAAR